jgi:hypothetical protein
VAGKDPAAAVKAFIEPIKSALGCFATGSVLADSYDPATEGILSLNGGKPTKLLGGAKVELSFSMRYWIVESDAPGRGPWKVTTAGYMYELRQDGKTLYEYHWHPISESHETLPHLHCAKLGKLHVPTGRIMIEDVLKLAVSLGAKPRNATSWRDIDGQNRKKFERGATWGVGPAPVPRAVTVAQTPKRAVRARRSSALTIS